MNDRDRLAADLETAFGIDATGFEADRLIALGWTRADHICAGFPCGVCGAMLDEERLARALASIPTDPEEFDEPTAYYAACAAAIAKAYREDTDGS